MDIMSENTILKRLKELEIETDFEFVIELIDIYLNETPKQIEQIKLMIQENDLNGLTTVAHTLKGSSRNIGADKLGEICFELEQLGRSARQVPENLNISKLEEEFQRVKTILENYKQAKKN